MPNEEFEAQKEIEKASHIESAEKEAGHIPEDESEDLKYQSELLYGSKLTSDIAVLELERDVLAGQIRELKKELEQSMRKVIRYQMRKMNK